MTNIDARIGKEFWFEYHCLESMESSDAELWLRSHQKVIVIERGDDDNDECPDEPRVYTVKFADGFTYIAFDDELMESKEDFYRPDPPK